MSMGLTALTFVTMPHVSLKSVALKLFTGVVKFEIMAIPFFILTGTMACTLFAAVSGSPAQRRLLSATDHGEEAPPQPLGGRGHLHFRRPRHRDPAFHSDDVYSQTTNSSVSTLFIAGFIARVPLAAVPGGVTRCRTKKFEYSRQPEASWKKRWDAFVALVP